MGKLKRGCSGKKTVQDWTNNAVKADTITETSFALRLPACCMNCLNLDVSRSVTIKVRANWHSFAYLTVNVEQGSCCVTAGLVVKHSQSKMALLHLASVQIASCPLICNAIPPEMCTASEAQSEQTGIIASGVCANSLLPFDMLYCQKCAQCQKQS